MPVHASTARSHFTTVHVRQPAYEQPHTSPSAAGSRSVSAIIAPPVFGLGRTVAWGAQTRTPELFGDFIRSPGPGEPLAIGTRSTLEASFSADFRSVRIHSDARSASAADRMSARAFTIGNHIFLGSHEQPTDLALIAHEATHVVQQQGGASIQRSSADNSGDSLEREAERAAAAVRRGEHANVQGRTGSQGPQFLFGWVSRGISAIGRGVRAAAGAVVEFAGNIIDRAVEYIRGHARSIPGYDLLGFILGRDPLTQRPVERNAVNLVRGLLGLIPGGAAMFENLQRARVIERAYEWVVAELARLNLSWSVIRGAIDRFLSSLGPSDILNLGGVFDRARAIFGPILSRILAFAAAAGKKILEFIFEGALALAGGAAQRILAIFRRIGATFSLIVNDPVQFLRNLINAVKGGFQRFASNILEHLKTALFDWLFGALQGAGLRLPARFNLEGIISIVLQVLGLTYERLRARLVRLIGEPAVATLERVFEFLRILVTQGIAAAWQKILEFASGLVDTVIESIRNWVITTIVKAAVTRIATMFNPVGAIINAIITIYNTVMFVIERARQIAAFVEAVIGSIDNIAHGNISAAINYVERTLARILSLVISFLARLIGLGGISDTIRNIIRRIQAIVDRAIDRVVDWIVQRARALVQAGRQAVGAALRWWRMRKSVTSGGNSFTLSTEGSESETRIIVAASPGIPWTQYLKTVNAKTKEQKDSLAKAKSLAAVIEGRRTLPPDQHASLIERSFNELAEHIKILNGTRAHPASVIEYGGTNSLGGGLEARARILSKIHPEGSSPRDSAPIWQNLQHLGAGLGKEVRKDWYVQGHLLNENLGGPGLRFNLTPITKDANNEHKRVVETELKKLVNDDGEVISYTVKALAPPPKGKNPRLRQLEKKTDLTKVEKDELKSLQGLQELTSGFKCTAYILEQDSSGKWTRQKKALDKATKTIENNIGRGGDTYGY